MRLFRCRCQGSESSVDSDPILWSELSCSLVHNRLESHAGETSCPSEGIHISTSPEDKSHWLHAEWESICDWPISQEHTCLHSKELLLVGILCRVECASQFPFVVKEQVFRVIYLLEEMWFWVVRVCYLFLLSLQSIAFLVAAKVVIYFLETFAGVHISKSFTLVILTEVNN